MRPIERLRTVWRCLALALAASGSAASAATIEISAAQTLEAAGLVDIRALVPDIALDIRYASAHNFVGEPIEGYDAPKCLLHRRVAEALARVEAELRKTNLRVRIFDCYRPVRAVKHFVRWAQDVSDERTKAQYYPNLDKSLLLGEYIAPVSGHSRAATLDLTLMSCNASGCDELDMGTPFDFFDARAHTDHDDIAAQQRANRQRLRDAMTREGFENYAAEWWHYTFTPEPTPDLQYDLVVR